LINKGKTKSISEKDELYLETLDIFFQKIKKIIPIVKPDISRLLGAESIQPEEYLSYTVNLVDNDKFEIITKSISKIINLPICTELLQYGRKKINEKKIHYLLPTQYLPLFQIMLLESMQN
jgi:hypothetical protein